MADELKDVLLGGMEAKRQHFASEDFAGGYGDGVVGRVKRRRAASATAMGGGTLVAIGAVAVGAWQLPRAGVVGPGSSPSVVCTTTTPDAVAGGAVDVPPGATYVVTDRETERAYFVGAVAGVAQLWGLDGTPFEMGQNPDGTGVFEFPSGAAVTIDQVDGEVTPADPSAVTVTPADAYVTEESSSVAVLAEDGTVLGKAVHASDGALLLLADRKLYTLLDLDGTTYSFVDSSGASVRVRLIDSDPAASSEPAGAPSPSVSCLTASPAPSESESAAAIAPSPFQCGYTLAEDTRNDNGLFVTQSEWLSAGDAEQRIRAEYADPAAAGIEMSGDDVPVAIIDYNIFSAQFATNGMAMSGAPTEGGGYVLGYDFVIESGGVVVATYTPTAGDRGIYFEFADGGTARVYGLDVRAESFTACPGVEPSAVAAGDLFAVAGVNPHNGKGPYYAWTMIKG
jgi:hypothetical protein